MRTMPQLTRRCDPNTTQETWGVYYGDVQVGTIAERAGKSGRQSPVAVGVRLLSR